MDFEKFFGKGVAERVEAPDVIKGKYGPAEPIYSSTIEEFYYHIDDALKGDKPFIYILDSMDGLSSEAEKNKFDENKKAHRKGKENTGSFGDGKAKKNSSGIRQLLTPLRKTGSILIIINQTRDNFGFGFEKKTRSGGHALKFYACLEMWSSVKKKIVKMIRGKNRQLGVECKIQVKKNRITGKDRTVAVPIYHSLGFDDIGSCIDYLIDEEHWKVKDKKIAAKEFDFIGTKEKLARHIETGEMEKDLKDIVGDVWIEIEEACEIKRKRRYE